MFTYLASDWALKAQGSRSAERAGPGAGRWGQGEDRGRAGGGPGAAGGGRGRSGAGQGAEVGLGAREDFSVVVWTLPRWASASEDTPFPARSRESPLTVSCRRACGAVGHGKRGYLSPGGREKKRCATRAQSPFENRGASR